MSETEEARLPELQPVTTSWNELVLICKDCERGEHLADGLKKRWKKREVSGVRVVRTSCLDVCKDDEITCVIAQADALLPFTLPSSTRTSVAEKAIAARLKTAIPTAEIPDVREPVMPAADAEGADHLPVVHDGASSEPQSAK